MPFATLAVRTGEEPASDLYPEPGEQPDTVEPEHGDGQPVTYAATTLTVTAVGTGQPKQLARLTDLNARIYVTDCRLAIACSKYQKGGGWGGFGAAGLAIAVTANTISKARAARRRRGKMLVGHVRYQWLGQVEAKDRSGMLSKNTLQLLYGNPAAEGVLILELILDKREPATQAAEQIVRRAATLRSVLAPGDAALASYAQEQRPENIGDGTLRYRLPTGAS